VGNLDAVNVVISSVDLDPAVVTGGELVIGPDTGGVVGGMSHGTAYLYVLDLAGSSAIEALPR
jgi:hypothetical protein